MSSELPTEQRKGTSLRLLIDYLQKGELPEDIKQFRIIVMKAAFYCIVDDIFYFINKKKRKCKLPVMPRQIQKRIIEKHHGGHWAAITQVTDLNYIIQKVITGIRMECTLML